MTRSLIFVLAALLLLPTVASAQQDLSGALNRIARLERELSDLQRSVYAGGQPPAAPAQPGGAPLATDGPGGAPLARLEIRLQQIEAEMRALTGRVEELGFRVQSVSDRMNKLQSDTDIRFQELSGGGAPAGTFSGDATAGPDQGGQAAQASGSDVPVAGAPAGTLGTLSGQDLSTLKATQPAPAPGTAAPAAAEAATAAPLPAGTTPERQYKMAFDNLVKHDLPTAEAAFTAFLQQHPDDPLAGNAQYWLGETYYARNRFQEAAVAFLEGYQNYPDSPKAADNLLKLGMSLARIDRKEEACTTFAKLGKDFPNAPTNIKRRLVNEVKALNCGA